MERARDNLRHPRRIVDLGRPLGHRTEHRAIVEFLKGLALTHVAPDLTDKHHQRRRVLPRDVNARRGIGGARAARDEAHAGAAGDLADRFGHHASSALLPADGDVERAVVKGIKHGEVAFPRHTEHVAYAVQDQLVDQNFGGGAQVVLGAHRRLLGVQLAYE